MGVGIQVVEPRLHAVPAPALHHRTAFDFLGRGFIELWASPGCAANFPRLDNLRLLRGLINRRPPQGRVGGLQQGDQTRDILDVFTTGLCGRERFAVFAVEKCSAWVG